MNRISRAYFPSNAASRSEPRGHAFLFERDLPLGIMPFRNTREDSAFAVRLDPDDAELRRSLIRILKIGHHDGYDLSDALIRFVETATHYLAAFGEICVEIIPEEDGVTLATLPAGRILWFWKRYLQIVPIRDWSKGSPKFISIPAERVWHIVLPRQLGSPRWHRAMLKALSKVSEPMPKFTIDIMNNDVKYDFLLHHKNKDIATEYLTRRWGSIPSFRQIKGTTEYYYIVNHLKFSKSQALIREHLVEELNNNLPRMGVTAKLTVEGLPASRDIDNVINKMQRGEVGFKEALDVAKMP